MIASDRGTTGKPGKKVLGAVWWRWVVVPGVLVAILTYALGLVLVSVYADFFGFLEGRGVLEVSRDQFLSFARLIGVWGMPALYLALTVGAALWAGRRVGAAAPLHGVLIGVVSLVVVQSIGLLFGPPSARELVVYPLLAVVGGFVGGLRSWAVRAGEEALYETSRAVSAARSPQEIATAIGENLAGSEVNSVSVWETVLREGEGDHLQLMGAWSPRPDGHALSGAHPEMTGMPTLTDLDGRDSRELLTRELPAARREVWERDGVRSLLLIPLVAPGGSCRGLLLITSRKQRGFSRRATRAYLTTGGPVVLAIENLRLVEQARWAGRRAGMLGERQRLAREIHDTLAQGFTSIVMNLEAAEGELSSEVPEGFRLRQYLDRARVTARESLAEARRLVWALRPESLENASLPEALTRLATRWSAASGVEVVTNVTGSARPLPVEAEDAIVRVVQEALANVLKHARAGRVVLTLSYMNDLVALDVIDDGAGFDPGRTSAGSPKGGFGLCTMRERVEQLGGSLSVESSPGEGVTLVVELPTGTPASVPERDAVPEAR